MLNGEVFCLISAIYILWWSNYSQKYFEVKKDVKKVKYFEERKILKCFWYISLGNTSKKYVF